MPPSAHQGAFLPGGGLEDAEAQRPQDQIHEARHLHQGVAVDDALVLRLDARLVEAGVKLSESGHGEEHFRRVRREVRGVGQRCPHTASGAFGGEQSAEISR